MSFSRARHGRARFGLVSTVAATLLLVSIGLPSVTGPNAVAQADEASYINPTYGYQIAWEPDVWEIVEGGPGDLALTSDMGEIYFQSGQFYAGDATACRDDLVDRLPDEDNVLSSVPFEGDGEQSAETEGRAYSTLQVELDETDGQDARTVIERIDCRTVVAGEAVLAITWLASIADADQAVAAADDLLEALVIPSFQGSRAEIDGLAGGTYTDPDLGFALTWDESDWASFVPVDAIFGLNSAASLISFSLPADFGGDAAGCVETTLDDLGSSPGIVDVTPIQVDGEDVAGLDDAGWSYAAIDANYGGAEQFVEARCASIPGSEVVLRAIHSGPIESYDVEAELAAPVFASLTVEGDGGAGTVSGATPVATDAPEPAATPTAGEGTPVLGNPAATPRPSDEPAPADDLDVFTSEDGGWSLAYDGTIWQPLDPAIYATVDLAIRGGSSVVTFDTTPTDDRDIQEILDDLVQREIRNPAGDDQGVERIEDVPVPSGDAVGEGYRYRTPAGVEAALGIIVIPIDGPSAVVVRVYVRADAESDDFDALEILLSGISV